VLIRENQIQNGFGLPRADPKDPTSKGDQHYFLYFYRYPIIIDGSLIVDVPNT
jgi:hypothetical protein